VPTPKKTDFTVCLFCVCVLWTQHRLTACGQHHFEQGENIVIQMRTQNDITATP